MMGGLGSFLCSPGAHTRPIVFSERRCSSKRAVGSYLAHPEKGRTSKLGRIIYTAMFALTRGQGGIQKTAPADCEHNLPRSFLAGSFAIRVCLQTSYRSCGAQWPSRRFSS